MIVRAELFLKLWSVLAIVHASHYNFLDSGLVPEHIKKQSLGFLNCKAW